jgi:hypothetical protein
MNYKETENEGMAWVQGAQVRAQAPAVVNAVINLLVP